MFASFLFELDDKVLESARPSGVLSPVNEVVSVSMLRPFHRELRSLLSSPPTAPPPPLLQVAGSPTWKVFKAVLFFGGETYYEASSSSSLLSPIPGDDPRISAVSRDARDLVSFCVTSWSSFSRWARFLSTIAHFAAAPRSWPVFSERLNALGWR